MISCLFKKAAGVLRLSTPVSRACRIGVTFFLVIHDAETVASKFLTSIRPMKYP
jgi:hypothetical protein